MMTFIQSEDDNLDKILSHLQTSAIMDLLLTLVRMEELPEGKGVVKVRQDMTCVDWDTQLDVCCSG